MSYTVQGKYTWHTYPMPEGGIYQNINFTSNNVSYNSITLNSNEDGVHFYGNDYVGNSIGFFNEAYNTMVFGSES